MLLALLFFVDKIKNLLRLNFISKIIQKITSLTQVFRISKIKVLAKTKIFESFVIYQGSIHMNLMVLMKVWAAEIRVFFRTQKIKAPSNCFAISIDYIKMIILFYVKIVSWTNNFYEEVFCC